MSKPKIEQLRTRWPQLLAAAIIVVFVFIVSVDAIEEVVVEGETLNGTILAGLFKIVMMITANVTATVASLGYVGIFVLMLLESTSLPIPSEVVLPFSGYLVSMGQLNFWITIFVSTIAGTLGCLVDYYIGLKGMEYISRRRALNNLLFNQGRLAIAYRWFRKYGASVVFLSRLVPGFRTLVSFPAGATRMSLVKFTALTAAGCLGWDAVLVYVGFYAGKNWAEVAGVSRYMLVAILAAVAVGITLFLVRRRKQAGTEETQTSSSAN